IAAGAFDAVGAARHLRSSREQPARALRRGGRRHRVLWPHPPAAAAPRRQSVGNQSGLGRRSARPPQWQAIELRRARHGKRGGAAVRLPRPARDMTLAADGRYFEDYPAGAVFEGGPVMVSEAEILEFARRYDPQAMHTNPAAAARGHFGGLIASGWHTAALMMRLFATHFLSPASSLALPGIDGLRLLA